MLTHCFDSTFFVENSKVQICEGLKTSKPTAVALRENERFLKTDERSDFRPVCV